MSSVKEIAYLIHAVFASPNYPSFAGKEGLQIGGNSKTPQINNYNLTLA